jgi:hypothetical protein
MHQEQLDRHYNAASWSHIPDLGGWHSQRWQIDPDQWLATTLPLDLSGFQRHVGKQYTPS